VRELARERSRGEESGPQFIEFVERKLGEHGVKKMVPDAGTLAVVWQRTIWRTR